MSRMVFFLSLHVSANAASFKPLTDTVTLPANVKFKPIFLRSYQHFPSFPMAPKRRHVKKGETRMDAALDAMEPFGFPRGLTRTTVHSLLKVYGGNSEGWVFIEDSGYTLLIDTLLEKQANSSPLDNMIEANPGDGPDEVTPAECADSALVTCCITHSSDDTPLTNQAIDAVSAASENGNQLFIKDVDTVSAATSEFGSQLPHKCLDISSVTSELGHQSFVKAAIKEEKESECYAAGNLTLVENHGPKSQLVRKLSHRKRKPCYGWISDDDEEELIDLL